MAVSKAQWNEALALLQRFERQVIAPEYFNWKYITDQLGISKPTLWRNKDFESEYRRIKDVVREYKMGGSNFDIKKALLGGHQNAKDIEILRLKERVAELTRQLSRERERLVYAAVIARRKNIDPAEFIQNSPVTVPKEKAKVTNISKKVTPTGKS